MVNILLWTSSLALASVGILFGFIASINATRANNQIKELISDQLIAEEASKFFFTLSTNVNNKNKSVIRKLKSKNAIAYSDYAILAAETRMAPLPSRVRKHLSDTEYADLATHYIHSKVRLDNLFKEIIEDYSVLTTHDEINKRTIAKLIKYHDQIGVEQKSIIKEYYTITKV